MKLRTVHFVVLGILFGFASCPMNSIVIPQGLPVYLDGSIAVEEWDDAKQVELNNGGTAYLKWIDESLGIAIHGSEQGYGHVCIKVEDTIYVLHSSASLGLARYERVEDDWILKKGFEWALWDSTLEEAAIQKRTEFLQREGWVASTAWMGERNHREYIISKNLLGDDRARFVILYLSDEVKPNRYYWPLTVTDDAINIRLGIGYLGDSMQFDPKNWAEIYLN